VYAPSSSNGNAAGNTLEEAVLHGLLELVERDCVAIWWYNMLKKPSVDIESFGDIHVLKLLDVYNRLNRNVWVLDITNDIGIPTFVAVSSMKDKKKGNILMGFGCHLEARLGISRALVEMNQSLMVCQHSDDSVTRNWYQNATCEKLSYMVPDEELAVKRKEDYPQFRGNDVLKKILKCEKTLEQCGLEVLVLDQTRPSIGLPVVKVVVPGLRHFWPRFAPGRLYDVPVQMGWVQTPLQEEDLNPIPMFL